MNVAMHFPTHISDRSIAIGIAVSVMLHLVVLFAFTPARQGPASSPGDMVLQARLMPRSAIRERASLPEPEQLKPEPVRPEPPRRVEPPPPSVTRLTVPAMATPAPATAPHVAAAPPALPSTPPSAPATPGAAAPQPVQPPPVAASAPPAAGSPGSQEVASVDVNKLQQNAADAGSIGRFLQDILMGARRYKRYPAQAMEKGWQGKVEIRLVMGSNGMPQSYSIKTSSGFQLLDDTALDMVKKGRPWAPVPLSLRGREFTVDVPVVFDLREG